MGSNHKARKRKGDSMDETTTAKELHNRMIGRARREDRPPLDKVAYDCIDELRRQRDELLEAIQYTAANLETSARATEAIMTQYTAEGAHDMAELCGSNRSTCRAMATDLRHAIARAKGEPS